MTFTKLNVLRLQRMPQRWCMPTGARFSLWMTGPRISSQHRFLPGLSLSRF